MCELVDSGQWDEVHRPTEVESEDRQVLVVTTVGCCGWYSGTTVELSMWYTSVDTQSRYRTYDVETTTLSQVQRPSKLTKSEKVQVIQAAHITQVRERV